MCAKTTKQTHSAVCCNILPKLILHTFFMDWGLNAVQLNYVKFKTNLKEKGLCTNYQDYLVLHFIT